MTALLGEIILHNFFLNWIACCRYPDKHNQLLKEGITRPVHSRSVTYFKEICGEAFSNAPPINARVNTAWCVLGI